MVVVQFTCQQLNCSRDKRAPGRRAPAMSLPRRLVHTLRAGIAV